MNKKRIEFTLEELELLERILDDRKQIEFHNDNINFHNNYMMISNIYNRIKHKIEKA